MQSHRAPVVCVDPTEGREAVTRCLSSRPVIPACGTPSASDEMGHSRVGEMPIGSAVQNGSSHGTLELPARRTVPLGVFICQTG
jgi:hypothetical protein